VILLFLIWIYLISKFYKGRNTKDTDNHIESPFLVRFSILVEHYFKKGLHIAALEI